MRKDRVTDVKDYQKAHLNKALQFCKQTRIGIDIGANYGIMSYNMSKVFGHVYAFEIDKNVYECLDRNVKELGLKNVDIFPYGLGDTTKTVGLNVKPGKSFSTHVNEDGNDAQIKTLDSFGFDSVDFLKIDAEGYEPLIIQGAMKTIERCKPIIFYERKGHEERFGYHKGSVLEMLKDLGYKDLAHIDHKNGVIGAD
jgi:FkbM family methyltransferase